MILWGIKDLVNRKLDSCPDQCGSVGWASSHKVKDPGFNPQSWHMPRMEVWSMDRAHTRGKQSMFLSHINVSLAFSLPYSLKINKYNPF